MVDVCTAEKSQITYELGVLQELQTVFSPEMAHASYIPFYCLIGETHVNSWQTPNVPEHVSQKSVMSLFS